MMMYILAILPETHRQILHLHDLRTTLTVANWMDPGDGLEHRVFCKN